MGRHSMGEFEHLVLLATLRLGPEAYGVPIIAEIEARTGRDVSQAAAYLTLKRLEKKGWLTGRPGQGSEERGSRQRRYFDITECWQLRRRERWPSRGCNMAEGAIGTRTRALCPT